MGKRENLDVWKKVCSTNCQWYRVILHDDIVNSVEDVVQILIRLYGFSQAHATLLAAQASETGNAECCIEYDGLARSHQQVMSLLGLRVSLIEFPDKNNTVPNQF